MELPAKMNMNYAFYIFSLLIILIISLIGFTVNFYFIIKSIFRKSESTGFQKICIFKTANNLIICTVFLIWVLPVTFFGFKYLELNYVANRLFSAISATWAYFLNSILQVCLACNRFYALYFPFGIAIWKPIPMANISIAIAITITTLLSFITFPVGCGYVYGPNFFIWRTEFHDCSKKIGVIFPYVILGTTITTNCFNVAIGIRLLARKMSGIREEEAKERRKRWMIMFTQSVFQDCLQLFDTLNSYYIVLISDATWFQFRFVTLSLVTIAMLDGLAMFACHSDIHPNWIKKLGRKRKVSKPVSVTLSACSVNKLFD